MKKLTCGANKTLITYTYCNNHATNILKTLAYIFDVNFKESFKIMVEQNMIEKKLKLLKEHVVKEEYEIEKIFYFLNYPFTTILNEDDGLFYTYRFDNNGYITMLYSQEDEDGEVLSASSVLRTNGHIFDGDKESEEYLSNIRKMLVQYADKINHNNNKKNYYPR